MVTLVHFFLNIPEGLLKIIRFTNWFWPDLCDLEIQTCVNASNPDENVYTILLICPSTTSMSCFTDTIEVRICKKKNALLPVIFLQTFQLELFVKQIL